MTTRELLQAVTNQQWVYRSARTQIARHSVSAPVSHLVRNHPGYVGGRTILNFGEGKARKDSIVLWQAGADIVVGYDPNHATSNSSTVRYLSKAQILVENHNRRWSGEATDRYDTAYCGYVFNTLPPEARADALDDAFDIADNLIIAVRRGPIAGRPYEDGVITGKGTFQKGWPNWDAVEREFVKPGDAIGFERLHSTSSYFLFRLDRL